jgi:hemolysin III
MSAESRGPVIAGPHATTRDLPRAIDQSILAATLAFSLVALTMLAHFAAAASTDRQRAVAILVYGATLATSALCSFLYHGLPRARCRPLLRYCDHAAIFLLIAGTYTPFAGVDLRGPLGFSVLEWVWGLTSLGMLLKLTALGAYDRAFVGLYIGVGWFILAAGRHAIAAIARPSLALLLFGGLVYTAGAIVYARDRGRWTAPIWHCCVLIGCLAHFLAVLVSAATPIA